MSDQFYFENGDYFEAGYFTIIREAEIAIAPAFTASFTVDIASTTGYYIPDYIEADYYTAGGITQTADAALASTATVTATVGRLDDAQAVLSAEIAQNAQPGAIRQAEAEFTDAFSPTITAIAFKNHTAELGSVFALTATSSVTARSDVTLSNIANLDAQAAKTVDAITATEIVTAQTTTASITTDSTSTINSAFTVIANAITPIFFDINLQVVSSFFVSKYTGSGRPRNLGIFLGTPSFNSSIKKFGTHSVTGSGGNATLTYNGVGLNPKTTDNFTWEHWVYQTSGGTSTATTGWLFFGTNANATFNVDVFYTDGTKYVNRPNTPGLQVNAWNHIVVNKDNTGVNIYLNGNSVYTNYTQPIKPIGRFASININTSTNYIDDTNLVVGTAYYSSSSSTITVPTSARANDPLYTRYLHHFDNNLLDDYLVNITQVASADLSTAATLAVVANSNTKQAAANFDATATVVALVGKTHSAIGNLSTEFATSTTATRSRTFDSAVNCEFAQITTVGVRKQFELDSLALFAPTITINAILRPLVFLETEFAHSTIAEKTARAQAQAATQSTITATLTGTVRTTAAVASEFTQNTQNIRVRQAAIAANSSLSLAATVGLNQNATAQFAAEFTKATAASRLRESTVQLESVTLQNTVNTILILAEAQFNGVFSQSTVPVRTRPFDSQFATDTTLSAQGDRTRIIQSTLGMDGTVTVTANSAFDSTVSIGALFTPTVGVVATVDPGSDITAQFTMVANAVKTVDTMPRALTGLRINNVGGAPAATIEPIFTSFYGLQARETGFTLSIWVKRNSFTDFTQFGATPPLNKLVAIVGRSTGYDNGGAFAFNDKRGPEGNINGGNTDVIFRANYDPDEPNPQWTNAAPRDTDWHHYLFKTGPQGSVGNYRYNLWVDGVYQGVSGASADIRGGFTIGSEGADNRLFLGQTSLTGFPIDGYPLQPSNFDGEIAQIWMGTLHDLESLGSERQQVFTVDKYWNNWYSGARDLGEDGGLTGLPTVSNQTGGEVYYYNALTQPFSGVTVIPPGTQLVEGSGLPLPYFNADFAFTVTPSAVVVTTANLSTASTVSAAVNAVRQGVILCEAAATAQSNINGVFGANAVIGAEFATATEAGNIRGFDGALTATAAIETQAGFFETAGADLSSAATVEVSIDVVPPTRAEANLSSQFAVDCLAVSFTDSITLTVSAATLSCTAELIPPTRAEAALEAVFALSVVTGTIEQFVSTKSSQFSLNCDANAFKGFISTTVTATVALSVQGARTRTVTAALPTIATNISLVDVVNIDQFRLLEIEAETRVLKILPESRVLTIEQETRINTIKGTP